MAGSIQSSDLSGLSTRHLSRFLRVNAKPHVNAIFGLSILINILLLAPAFHMLQVYDRVLASGSMSTLVSITLITLSALLAYGVLETMRTRVAQRLSAVYTVFISRKLFSSLLHNDAEAGRYLREFGLVKTFLAGKAFVSLFDLPLIPLYLVLLYLVHPLVCLINVIGIVALIFVGYLNIKRTEDSRADNRSADGQVVGFAQISFAKSEQVRSLGILPNLMRIWEQKTAGALETAEFATRQSAYYYALGRVVRQCIQVITMAWGAMLVINGQMSGGLIFLSSMISGKALAPIEQIIAQWDHFSKSIEAFNSIDALTGQDKGLQMRPQLPEPKGYLEAREVSFANEQGRTILARASLQVRPAEVVLIEGVAGAGKSLLLRMLAGGLDPQYGLIALDGAPRARWPHGQWGGVIAHCGEQSGLIYGTVASNIARFDANADLKEVYRVAKLVGVHDTIVNLAQGYQTLISDSALALSTSQRMQIALARTFYGSPRVLLLDNPSAGLDQYSEGSLVNALSQARQDGAAIILVSRSPLLHRIVDRAMVVQGGSIVATANPDRPIQRFGAGQSAAATTSKFNTSYSSLAELGA